MKVFETLSNVFVYILIYLTATRCRLLNTFAEEQAIEDALYYLSDALQRGVIDIEQFLKVRVSWLRHSGPL